MICHTSATIANTNILWTIKAEKEHPFSSGVLNLAAKSIAKMMADQVDQIMSQSVFAMHSATSVPEPLENIEIIIDEYDYACGYSPDDIELEPSGIPDRPFALLCPEFLIQQLNLNFNYESLVPP